MQDHNFHRFGPFLVIRTLGRGGMGEVFVARTPWAEHPLAAVKRLRPDVARVPTFAERFAHEAELAVRLAHPNVVGTLDVGSVEGQLYVASQLVYGKDTGLIADRLRERGQGGPAAVAIRLLLDTLAGLAYVHGVGEPDGKPLRLVHRDVTPGNVLVGYDGQARVADFGLAKSLLTEKSNLTNHGEILGTPHYLAPEVIRGEQASPLSDLYGLGAVMYRFLTGIAPHQGTTAEVLLKVLSEEPRPLSDLRPDLAPWLVSFVHRLLEKDPNRRPYDANALLQQLTHDARSSGLLVNRAAVGRWIANLFEAEKAEELEERDRLIEIDPETMGGGRQEGTVVLARPNASTSLEAPAGMLSGAEEDRDSAGTELDLPEAQVRAVVGQLDPRLVPTTPPRSMLASNSDTLSGASEPDSVDGMPTRAVNIWPNRDLQSVSDSTQIKAEDTLDPVTREEAPDEATRLGAIVAESGPNKLPGFVDATAKRADPFEIGNTAPEPDSPKQRPRNKDSVVVSAAPASVPPRSAKMDNEPTWRVPDPAPNPPTPGPVPVVRTVRPQPAPAPRPQPATPPPVQVRRQPTRPSNTGRRNVILLGALLTLAVILGVGIGSFIASMRAERPVLVAAGNQQKDRQRFLDVQKELDARRARGEALPAGAVEAYGAAAAALVEGNEAVMKTKLDEVDKLLRGTPPIRGTHD